MLYLEFTLNKLRDSSNRYNPYMNFRILDVYIIQQTCCSYKHIETLLPLYLLRRVWSSKPDIPDAFGYSEPFFSHEQHHIATNPTLSPDGVPLLPLEADPYTSGKCWQYDVQTNSTDRNRLSKLLAPNGKKWNSCVKERAPTAF